MQASGRPKDLEKRKRILEAAKIAFLKHGYHNASMNQIAKDAGVTKLTVYNHFQDKANLFICAIEESCQECIATRNFQLSAENDFLQSLHHVCECAIYTIYLPEALKLEHVLFELAAEQSPLTEKFFNASHQRLCSSMTDFFQQASNLGFIRADIPIKQTELIMSLLLGLRHHHVLLGMEAAPNTDELQQSIADAIEIFMLKYGI